MTASPPTNILDGPSTPQPRNRGFADRLFLWIPRQERPGLLAYLLCLVRMVAYPLPITALMVVLLVVAHVAVTPLSLCGLVITLLPAAVFEELARYTFVRRAADPVRAIVVFTACTLVVETASFLHPHASLAANLLLRAPSWGLHLVAGAVVVWAVRQRPRHPNLPVFVVLGLMFGHAAFNVAITWAFEPLLVAAAAP